LSPVKKIISWISVRKIMLCLVMMQALLNPWTELNPSNWKLACSLVIRRPLSIQFWNETFNLPYLSWEVELYLSEKWNITSLRSGTLPLWEVELTEKLCSNMYESCSTDHAEWVIGMIDLMETALTESWSDGNNTYWM